MAQTPSLDENPGQVQDELRRVRRRPAGTRDPGSAQREGRLGRNLNRCQTTALLPQETCFTFQWQLLTLIDSCIFK